ncbi:MAG TPA: YqiA/YcfP family alpha/beta fold hydrolase [Pyrinomonadaceae bacterium]|jgi:predicted peptidase
MHSLFLSLLFRGALSLTTTAAPGAGQQAGILNRTVNVDKTEYTYQVYVPARLQGQQNLPVILFLHGIGQRGEGGFIQGRVAALAGQYLERIPAIVVLPQCSKGTYWHDPEMTRMTMEALEKTVEEFGADRSRLYLIGVSMGGYGAWHMAAESPHKFAAVVPICGGSPLITGDRFTPLARRIGQTPVWAFHGADDRIVPVTESRQMVEALKAANGNVRYSEYPGVGHNVWLKVIGERELMPWLLKARAKTEGAKVKASQR